MVNADMSRSAHGRLNIQERQIACEPVTCRPKVSGTLAAAVNAAAPLSKLRRENVPCKPPSFMSFVDSISLLLCRHTEPGFVGWLADTRTASAGVGSEAVKHRPDHV